MRAAIAMRRRYFICMCRSGCSPRTPWRNRSMTASASSSAGASVSRSSGVERSGHHFGKHECGQLRIQRANRAVVGRRSSTQAK